MSLILNAFGIPKSPLLSKYSSSFPGSLEVTLRFFQSQRYGLTFANVKIQKLFLSPLLLCV